MWINFITKTVYTILLAIVSMIVDFVVYFMGGTCLGRLILHPLDRHYECACDEPPVLTILEAGIYGAIFMVLLLIGLDYIMRKINFDKTERIIALIILFLSNLYICYQLGTILTSSAIC